jgi:hypothetical protein
MTEPAAQPSPIQCSFCGKSPDEVRKLIAGPTVNICDECIDFCNGLIEEMPQPDHCYDAFDFGMAYVTFHFTDGTWLGVKKDRVLRRREPSDIGDLFASDRDLLQRAAREVAYGGDPLLRDRALRAVLFDAFDLGITEVSPSANGYLQPVAFRCGCRLPFSRLTVSQIAGLAEWCHRAANDPGTYYCSQHWPLK